MTRSKSKLSFVLTAAAALSLALSGCAKKDEKKGDTKKTPAAKKPTPEVKKPEVKKPEPKPEPKPVAAAAGADFVKVMASHEPATPTDPVTIAIEKFSVKSAEFDPANLEGATAEIELDLASIKSDKDKRDGHLKTADYLDVGKFATATVKVADVKKKADKTYTANADVTAHGVTKKLPVEFTVVDAKDDWVKVNAKHEFNRMDFTIGKEPDGKDERVGKKMTIEMQLTLKKS